MKQPSFDLAVLRYPRAVVLDSLEKEGSTVLLLQTKDELAKVWKWYARKFGVGISPAGVGYQDLEAGRMLYGTRRTARVFNRQSPYSSDEHPQVMVLRQGIHAVTVVLSRGSEDESTRIMLFVLAALPEPVAAEQTPPPEEFAAMMARTAASAMIEAGYNADFSVGSLSEVDRLIDEHSNVGQPITQGYFDPDDLPEHNRTMVRLFSLGCYVGEVLKKEYGGDWYTDSPNPKDWINTLVVQFPTAFKANPIGKVFKRFENGPEDNIKVFGYLMAMFATRKEDESSG